VEIARISLKGRTMWTRGFLIMLLLCPASVLAQTLPDFSGVFLRNLIDHRTPFANPVDPPVLVIDQGVEKLQITVNQNGAQTTSVYNLSGKPIINVGPDGMWSKDRIKFKGRRLLIKSEAVVDPRFAGSGLIEEVWELSPDLQALTIRPKGVNRGYRVRDSRRMETYTRQTSLEAALEKAQWASGMTICNANSAFADKLRGLTLDRRVIFGVTGFQELAWQVFFTAGLSGEFFDDLKRTNASGGVEFRKKGKLISAYSGSLILEVTPKVTPDLWQPLWTLPVVISKKPLPDWLQTLRFRIQWVGSNSRDLGEIPSELELEPWPDVSGPKQWYRLEIPAHDVPITDRLEIQILLANGKQVGCISGHI
jgi:hypothetical protein